MSIGSRQDYGLNRGELPQVGDVAIATAREVMHSFVLVDFKHYGIIYSGRIHIGDFGKNGYGFISNLAEIVPIGAEYSVVLKSYVKKFECWDLQRLPQADEINQE